MKKILIVTGGSGGHVIPSLSIYDILKDNFEVNDIRNILSKKGNTKVNLIINKNNQKACYSLQNNRKFGLDHYNLLKSKEYVLKITV